MLQKTRRSLIKFNSMLQLKYNINVHKKHKLECLNKDSKNDFIDNYEFLLNNENSINTDTIIKNKYYRNNN